MAFRTSTTFRLPAALVAGAIVAFAPAEPDTRLTANLAGVSEIPGPGDPDGTGTAELTLELDQSRVCYTFEIANVDDLTQAHIHSGGMGQSGPPVVTLSNEMTADAKGCARAEQDVIRRIAANPTEYYVNVHNREFPNGALRGQLRAAQNPEATDAAKEPPVRR